MLKADYSSDRFRGISVTEKPKQEVLKSCPFCNTRVIQKKKGQKTLIICDKTKDIIQVI